MNDNEPIEVIRSHHDDNFSLHSHQNDHEPPRTHIEPPVDADEKYNRDVPPDGGYGWVCVACVFWINAHTWGINSVSKLPIFSISLPTCMSSYTTTWS